MRDYRSEGRRRQEAAARERDGEDLWFLQEQYAGNYRVVGGGAHVVLDADTGEYRRVETYTVEYVRLVPEGEAGREREECRRRLEESMARQLGD